MNITDAMKRSLVDAAQSEYYRIDSEATAAYKKYNELQTKKDEAFQALSWAKNLQVGTGFAINSTRSVKPRSLWFFASRSGKTFGHFIEKHDDGNWSCSCTGFNYRADCWASRMARSYDDQKSPRNRWYDSYYNFDKHNVPRTLEYWRA